MNARLTKKARTLLNNKVLATKVVKAICEQRDKLEKGEIVRVDSVGFQLTTMIKTK
jgi:hypothetical protein